MVGKVGLCQEAERRFLCLQFTDGLRPEGNRQIATVTLYHIAAEAVDIGIGYPVFHRINHCRLNGIFSQVKLPYITIAIGVYFVASRCSVVVRIACHPVGFRCRVVGHPVEPHLHAFCMCCIYERLQVVQRSIRSLHRIVIFHGVGAVAVAALVDRHEIDNVHTEVLQIVYLLCGSSQCTLRGESVDVELVDYFVALTDTFAHRQGDDVVICTQWVGHLASRRVAVESAIERTGKILLLPTFVVIGNQRVNTHRRGEGELINGLVVCCRSRGRIRFSWPSAEELRLEAIMVVIFIECHGTPISLVHHADGVGLRCCHLFPRLIVHIDVVVLICRSVNRARHFLVVLLSVAQLVILVDRDNEV